MKKVSFKSFFYALLMSGTVSLYSCSTDSNLMSASDKNIDQQLAGRVEANVITGKYIVVFKEDFAKTLNRGRLNASENREENAKNFAALKAEAKTKVSEVLKGHKISETAIEDVYGNAVFGFAGKLSKEQAEVLRKDERVAYVEEDQIVTLAKPGSEGSMGTFAQSTPWGITKIGGFVDMTGSSRWAWVIDSGIDLDHPDLNVNTAYGRTFVGGTPDDANGHGTHVAGTIAAKNNTIGVVGVAAGATVVPVRVFGASGSSSNSVIISGIDYVTSVAKAGDVANMSLGGGASTATDDAVRRLAAKGVRVALAAGNESQNANNVSPARVNATNVWTVSAFDSSNRFASFSNYANPPIDISAPGVSVYSCWLNGGYNTISGTSMATPHVAGILLVNNGVLYTNGTVTGDRDTTPDPIVRR